MLAACFTCAFRTRCPFLATPAYHLLTACPLLKSLLDQHFPEVSEITVQLPQDLVETAFDLSSGTDPARAN